MFTRKNEYARFKDLDAQQKEEYLFRFDKQSPIVAGNVLLYWFIPMMMMLSIAVFILAIQLDPDLSTSMLEQVRTIMSQLESMILLTSYLVIGTLIGSLIFNLYRSYQKRMFFKKCDKELFEITNKKKSKPIIKTINQYKQVCDLIKNKTKRFLEWLI